MIWYVIKFLDRSKNIICIYLKSFLITYPFKFYLASW